MSVGTELVRWHSVADVDELRRVAAQRTLDAAVHAIEARNRFLIVLAGGNTPRGVYRLLRSASTDWTRWHIYLGDERCVPRHDNERNSKMAADAWLDHVPIPQSQIRMMAGELGAEEAALAYAAELRNVGEFDLVLLGLGEDGHTASLFPGRNWGTEADAPDALAVFDAPKSPRERVSLSAARLSRAREVLFLVAGESKRDAVTRWRSGEHLPAAAITPAAGIDALVESSLLEPKAD